MSSVFYNLLIGPVLKRLRMDYRLTSRQVLLCRAFALKYLKAYEKGTLKRIKKRLENHYARKGLPRAVIENIETWLEGLVRSEEYALAREYDGLLRGVLDKWEIPEYVRGMYYAFANRVVGLARKHSGKALDRAIKAVIMYNTGAYGLSRPCLMELAQLTVTYYEKITESMFRSR